VLICPARISLRIAHLLCDDAALASCEEFQQAWSWDLDGRGTGMALAPAAISTIPLAHFWHVGVAWSHLIFDMRQGSHDLAQVVSVERLVKCFGVLRAHKPQFTVPPQHGENYPGIEVSVEAMELQLLPMPARRIANALW
jgi:hypothetical protein